MATFGKLAGTIPCECGRLQRNEDPPSVGRDAYELVTTSAPQEQFLECGGAVFSSNDSGSSFSRARASRPEVERFAGAMDPNMAWCWINRLEKFFDEMVYPNDKRIVWAAALLDGDAHYWWMSITQGYEEPSSITWTKFLTHFFNKYINSGARLATSSTEFRPLVEDVVSRDDELRSRLRPRDVDGPSQGPSKRATSDFVVKSRTNLVSSYVTVNHGGSWKRKKTHQQTPTKVGATRVRVEPIKQVAHMKCFNCSELGHISKDCTKPRNQACFKCGQSGHIVKECTQPQRNKQGNQEEQ